MISTKLILLILFLIHQTFNCIADVACTICDASKICHLCLAGYTLDFTNLCVPTAQPSGPSYFCTDPTISANAIQFT